MQGAEYKTRRHPILRQQGTALQRTAGDCKLQLGGCFAQLRGYLVNRWRSSMAWPWRTWTEM